MYSAEKFNIECSTETFAEVFGKDYLNGNYSTPRKLEINGKKFEHQVSAYEIDWTYGAYGAKIGNVQVEGHIRRIPTEKELREEKIQRLKIELKQAKNKLEDMWKIIEIKEVILQSILSQNGLNKDEFDICSSFADNGIESLDMAGTLMNIEDELGIQGHSLELNYYEVDVNEDSFDTLVALVESKLSSVKS